VPPLFQLYGIFLILYSLKKHFLSIFYILPDSGTIAVPAPLHYAGKLAELIGSNVRDTPHKYLSPFKIYQATNQQMYLADKPRRIKYSTSSECAEKRKNNKITFKTSLVI